MKYFLLIFAITFTSLCIKSEDLDVFGIGLYDVKLDGSQTNEAIDFRYETTFSIKHYLTLGLKKKIFSF